MLYTAKSVKYLDIKIDENLNWHEQINVAVKLNRSNAMSSNVRHSNPKQILKKNQSMMQFLNYTYSIVLFG